TAKVTTFEGMFQNCTGLTSLDISSFTLKSSQNTQWMINKCSGLKSLAIPSTANVLDGQACSGIGTQSAPCALNYPSNFTPEKTYTGSGWYMWKNGYFKDGTTPTPSSTEAYAVLSGSTLTFYYDKNKASRSGTKYSLNSGTNNPGWSGSAASITKVVFNSNFEDARPESCYRWFNGMSKLTSITGIEYLNTEDVTNMTSMFNGCSVLTNLDVSNFDTSSVKDMSYMFNGCSKLNSINFALSVSVRPNGYPSYYSGFVTKAVTNLRNMFSGCSSLASLELPEFEITSSKNSTEMFKGCSALQLLHIQGNYSGINASAFSGVGTTSKPCELEFADATIDGVTTRTPTYFQWKAGYFKDYRTAFAVYMEDSQTLTFYYDVNEGSFMSEMHDYNLNEGSAAPGWLEFASNVKTVRISEGFKDARPTSCSQWFRTMSNITKIEGLENLNTEYATNMDYMFSGDTKLTSVDVSHFNTKKVTDMSYMFNNCTKLTSLDLSSFTFVSGSNTTVMINKGSGLKTLTVPSTANNLASDACKGVGTASAPITLNYPSGFTPEKTSTGSGYFVWKSGYFKETGTTPPTPPTNGEMYAVLNNNTLTFYCDNSKSSRTGTKYSMNVTGNAPKWYNNTSITGVVFDASFAGARPTTCYGWFYGLEGQKTITGIGNLNTSNVESMYSMFNKCSKLTSLDVRGFSTANVTNMSYMFNGCSGVKTLDVSKFNTAKVTTFEGMFQNCTGLTSLDISSFTLKSSQNTQWMINKCSGLKSLAIPSTANVLDGQACSGIGTQSAPCTLIHASGFTPEKTYSGSGWYMWKNGYFKSATRFLGDVNLDGKIDVTDVMCIVDYVLGKSLNVFSGINADMDSDGSINITDAMLIVDIILNKPSSVAAATSISNSDVVYVTGRGSELDLHLKGSNVYKAAEMTLVLPEGCSLYKAELNPIRIHDHDLIINNLDNGIYRIVVLSVTGREFSPTGSALIHLTLEGDCRDNVVVGGVVM
ncbi:MAG: BspA family leucine-rich repeat surface protein, partial [Bacteroidales bacterium]|nr:BspA family leucine-rich repeat surface protein [Bacteroidales bacterium]